MLVVGLVLLVAGVVMLVSGLGWVVLALGVIVLMGEVYLRGQRDSADRHAQVASGSAATPEAREEVRP